MTIRGFFDPTDPMQKPLVDGMIYFPRLRRVRALTFEIDTGADATALCYADRTGFVLDVTEFDGAGGATGAGGVATYGVETAVNLLRDDQTGFFARPVRAYIAMSSTHSPSVSLLGRDFLRHTVLHMDMSENEVTMEPLPPQRTGARL